MPYTRTASPLRAIPRALFLFTFLAIAASGWSKVVYVNKNATGTVHDGASWSTAYLTVQAGIYAALANDEVWVAKGVYFEGISLTKAYVGLYGGFTGTETARSQRDWMSNATVLDAGGDTTIGVGAFHQGNTLDGFTVRNGKGIQTSVGTGTISNCIISGNVWGIYALIGSFSISNCTICGNGYGIVVQSGPQTITNCTISGNGTGIDVKPGYSATITNSIVAYNGTGVVREDNTASISLACTDVFGNSAFNFSNTPDPTGTNGNISVDPKLSSPYRDIHLQPGSPCIDAGEDSAVTPGKTDLYGKPRILGARVDMGSDESDGTTWTSPASRRWYVSPSGNDGNDGSTWATAKKTVRGGLGVAQATDEVWVANGTYTENIMVPAAVAFYGGFSGTETARTQRGLNTKTSSLVGAETSSTLTALTEARIDGFNVKGTSNTSCIVLAASGTIANCTISGGSHGVDVWQSATITNCTICANANAGIIVYGSASISNCIVAFSHDGISAYDLNSQVTLSHNDVYGNTHSDYYSVIPGANDLKLDPLFVNYAGGDYHLQVDSPCINSGDDSVVTPGAADVDGQPRIIGPHVDIGSDECSGAGGIVHPANCYISMLGDDTSDGSSWAKAKRTVAAGLASAVPGDYVWVAKGTYYETIGLPQGVSLYGGFAGSETSLSQRDWTANSTILDGNSASNPVVRAYVGGTTIDGFTIRNADAGIDVGGSATISNCNVSGKAYGIYAYQCPVTVSRCTISNSPVGLYATGATAVVTNCSVGGSSTYGIQIDGGSATLANSTVTANGKGVYVNGGAAAINACTISGNLAEGAYVLGNTTLSNCAITGNSTRGVLVDGGSAATISNCTISGNNTIGVCIFRGSAPTTNSIVAFNGNGFLRFDPTGSEALSHNDVYGNALGNYSTVPDPGTENGNISADPQFTNRFNGDYHLSSGSPCIDAGDDSAVPAGAKDLDGMPRIHGAHVDLGAFEFGSTYYSPADAARALRIAAGLETAPGDISYWNVAASTPGIDLIDAIHIVRKAAGLEPNP